MDNCHRGAVIRAWRQRYRVGQAALARHLQIHPSTVWKWEHGIQKPPPYIGLILDSLAVYFVEKQMESEYED